MISRFVSLCLPSTGSSSVMISRLVFPCRLLLDWGPSWLPGLSPFVSLLLDPLASWLPLLFPFVSLLSDPVPSWTSVLSPFCFPSTGSTSILLSRPVSPFYWFPGLSPFVSLLSVSWIQFHHDFEAFSFFSPHDWILTMISRVVSLTPFRAHGSSSILFCNLVSLRPALPFFSRWTTWPWFGCLSPFASLVISWCRDPVPWWFATLSSFAFLSFSWCRKP